MTAPATKCPVILVVESEFLIRMATAEAIRDAGFEVIEAMNADAAMDMLESRSDVQFVFTEIHISGSMDGAELARAIKGRWPHVRLIATYGSVPVGTLDLPVGTVLYPKPYSPEQIACTVHALTASA